MAGGGSGGGGQAPPATQTQITDVPEWMRGYLQDVLGRAQTISDQPYQQFPGPKVAGFTPDQLSAFSQIQGLNSQYAPTQQNALDAATSGANTANNIYGAGAGDINASTGYNPLAAVSPYLGASAGYNSAAAGQPWLNQAAGYQGAAAQAGTPQGIQSYMSPYTSSVVQGIQDQANQNWNQNIMPGINDKFVGSGQYGSGRNAQVLGQAAGNFQTGLSANVANALESGYNTAGGQAAQQAQLLAGLGGQSITGANTAGGLQTSQVGNLLNQATTAGTAAQQQAANLQSAGTALGNLTATQGGQQLAAGTTLGNLAQQQQQTGVQNAQALQAVGQQQQQLNQTNLDVAQQDWQNQANYPKDQTQWMANIVRGLPNAGGSTTQQQTPAYSISPLAALGGAGATALTLSGSVGAKKKGGLIKGYAAGGQIDKEYGDDGEENYLSSPLDSLVDDPYKVEKIDYADAPAQDEESAPAAEPAQETVTAGTPLDAAGAPDAPTVTKIDPLGYNGQLDKPDSTHDVGTGDVNDAKLSATDRQRNQLLSLARGMLTPTRTGSVAEALGQSIGNLQEYNTEQRKLDISRLSADQLNQYRQAMLQNKATGSTGVIERIAASLRAENPKLTYAESIALAHKAPDEDKDELRKETLALNARKAGAEIDGIENPTLNDYRKFYGVKNIKETPKKVEEPGWFSRHFGSGGDKAPAAPAPVQTDIDYLVKNPTKAAAFNKRFGSGAAEKYLGQ